MSRQGAKLQKFYKRSYIASLSYLSSAIKKILDKTSFQGHLNENDLQHFFERTNH